MNLHDLPPHQSLVLHGPPVPPRMAARRLCDASLKGKYKSEGFHPYQDVAGGVIYWRIRVRLADGNKWIRPMRVCGMVYELKEPEFINGKKPLYGLDQLAKADPAATVWFVEGEAKVDALRKLGIVATTAGGATSEAGTDFEPLLGRHVILWPDYDETGDAHMRRVATILRGIGCTVEMIAADAIGLSKHGDVVDWLTANPNAVAADLMLLPRLVEPLEGSIEGFGGDVVLRRMSDIAAQSVRWLWPGRIARGKVTLIAGHPGLGKSQLSASLAAIVTTVVGGRWIAPRASRGLCCY